MTRDEGLAVVQASTHMRSRACGCVKNCVKGKVCRDRHVNVPTSHEKQNKHKRLKSLIWDGRGPDVGEIPQLKLLPLRFRRASFYHLCFPRCPRHHLPCASWPSSTGGAYERLLQHKRHRLRWLRRRYSRRRRSLKVSSSQRYPAGGKIEDNRIDW